MKRQIVSVIGLGYVGLPTACVIANCKNKKSQKKWEAFIRWMSFWKSNHKSHKVYKKY